MQIRGAPAIASLASLGIAAELLSLLRTPSEPTKYFPATALSSTSSLNDHLLKATAYLLTSRPTAVNLREGLDRIEAASRAAAAATGSDVRAMADEVIDVAVKVWSDDRQRNVSMGDHGAKWILERSEREGRIEKGGKVSVLTVCNTGSLATSVSLAWFSARTRDSVLTLSRAGLWNCLWSHHLPAQDGPPRGKPFAVSATSRPLAHALLPQMAYFAQTGPYQQGARLTAMELAAIGAPHTMVCDTAIGALLAEKPVHLFVAGADRITRNGDVANKVSTFQIATMCAHPHPFSPNKPVPVLVAAPVTTLDLTMASGREIVIEQRPSWEACTVRGRVVEGALLANQGEKYLAESEVKVETVLVTPPGVVAYNPAFDVTPAKMLAGIVTELGVAERKEGEEEFDLAAFVKNGGN